MKTASVVMFALAIAAFPSAVLAGGAVHPPNHWVLRPGPTASDLAAISCASVSQCFAVGAEATILKTINGGTTWKLLDSSYVTAHPSASFTSIRCPVPGVCSVLSPPNTVLRTTDGGQTWHAHEISLPPLLSHLSELACPTRKVCFATASPSGDPFSWFSHSAAIFKTDNGNRSWRRLTIPRLTSCPGDCGTSRVGFDLQWISCQSGRSCRAGGDTFIGSHEGYASAALRTDDGGANWKLVNNGWVQMLPNYATCPTASVCMGIYYEPLTPSYGPNLMRSTNGGATWSSKFIGPVLTAIACTGKTFCELAGPHGHLARTNKTRLAVQASPTTRDISAVACPSARACYAVGAAGTILTLDG